MPRATSPASSILARRTASSANAWHSSALATITCKVFRCVSGTFTARPASRSASPSTPLAVALPCCSRASLISPKHKNARLLSSCASLATTTGNWWTCATCAAWLPTSPTTPPSTSAPTATSAPPPLAPSKDGCCFWKTKAPTASSANPHLTCNTGWKCATAKAPSTFSTPKNCCCARRASTAPSSSGFSLASLTFCPNAATCRSRN